MAPHLRSLRELSLSQRVRMKGLVDWLGLPTSLLWLVFFFLFLGGGVIVWAFLCIFPVFFWFCVFVPGKKKKQHDISQCICVGFVCKGLEMGSAFCLNNCVRN